MKKALTALAIVAAFSASTAANASVVIDTFSVAQGQILDTTINGTGVWSTATGATTDIAGGVREMYVERLGGSASQVFGATSSYVDAGEYSFSSGNNVAGTGVLRWDGVDSAANGTMAFGANARDYSLGANLSQVTSFLLDVTAADLGFKFSLTVYKDAATFSTITLTSSGIAGLRYIPLAGFLAPSGFYDDPFNAGADLNVQVINNGLSAIDFLNVGALEAVINPGGSTLALDLSISSASAIPEPSSLALVGLGLLGAGALRRRRTAR